MLWWLAVLSQRAMSLQLKRLAGSPGRRRAGRPHIPDSSLRWVHTKVMSLQQAWAAASRLPARVNTACALRALSLRLTTEMFLHHREAVSKAAVTSPPTCRLVNESTHSWFGTKLQTRAVSLSADFRNLQNRGGRAVRVHGCRPQTAELLLYCCSDLQTYVVNHITRLSPVCERLTFLQTTEASEVDMCSKRFTNTITLNAY